ncbi:MAG: AzlD domain-containing protein [Propionibacteriaceae bacterium]|jgi:uncharacterized membrane protein|nr:AzlD domain-containing protein [Propionibacteriaceae bacterium]
MRVWLWILFASVTAYATKFAGYLLPRKWLANPSVPAITGAATVGLLAALTTTSALADGQSILLDSRLLALAAALVALRLKAPFIAVVAIGALGAALGRMAGLP